MSASLKSTARRSEVLADVAAKATQIAQEFGLDPSIAEQMGAEIADHVAESWGGQVVSFPRDCHYKLVKRERLILDEWRSGVSFADLARRYHVHVRSIRRLINRARVRDRNLDQRDMFGE